LEFEGNKGQMGIGSGVVIDSDPQAEYAECKLKARFLTDPAPEFELIESLLWQGCYPRMDLHLDRLMDSASYFGFACDREQIETGLLEHARSFPNQAARKVRLLLDGEGNYRIGSEELVPGTNDPVRVRIATSHTESADQFLFHKTTHRKLYAQAFADAQREGFAEVLFFNERGELTEGAISNVFLERDGCWGTPPVVCGLLAGVERRHLLATRPEIKEQVLREQDLREADAVWLTNAVRGLRRAQIVWGQAK
jgi:para-aminobenzoate synthetase/4-amino-4-deoxychorismate lyase